MKHLHSRPPALAAILAIAAVLAAFSTPALAQGTQGKIALIDLKKVFDGYHKTKQADVQLKERAADLDKARRGIAEDGQKAQEEYRKLVESANDPAISKEEAAKRKKDAEKKLMEIKEIEQSFNLFERNSRETLGTQQRRMREGILREIREVIDAKAKADGYMLVLDSAAESVNQTVIVLYTDGQNDITEAIAKQLADRAPTELPRGDDAKDKAAPAPAPASDKK